MGHLHQPCSGAADVEGLEQPASVTPDNDKVSARLRQCKPWIGADEIGRQGREVCFRRMTYVGAITGCLQINPSPRFWKVGDEHPRTPPRPAPRHHPFPRRVSARGSIVAKDKGAHRHAVSIARAQKSRGQTAITMRACAFTAC